MRTILTIKNLKSNLYLSFLNSVIGFLIRYYFIQYLGIELLGLNSLFLSLISFLSIFELGIGNAIYYSLFKPLLNNDLEKINSIVEYFKKTYYLVSSFVLIFGLILSFFLPFLITTTLPFEYVYSIYYIFLFDSFFSYFLSYRRTILMADQKTSVISNLNSLITFFFGFIQVFFLILSSNYILFLTIRFFSNIILNFLIYFKTKKLYPYLGKTTKNLIDINTKKEIQNNALIIFLINISSFLVFGTDNILLSVFVGINSVAIYSNYVLIITTINSFFNLIVLSSSPSVGNYLTEKGFNNDSYSLFQKINFVNFVVILFTSSSLIVLTNDFLKYWFGDDLLWPLGILILLVFNNYSRHILSPIGVFITSSALYNRLHIYRYAGLIEGLVNLIISLLLIVFFNLGIYGIILGTTFSTFVSTFFMPYLLFNYAFKNRFLAYIHIYIKQILILFFLVTTSFISTTILKSNYIVLNLILGFIINIFLNYIFIYFIYSRTDEFGYFKRLVLSSLTRKFKRL
jgi:O-antigen/teichoic acid export membrane protein